MKPTSPEEFLLEAYRRAPASVRNFIDTGGMERLTEALVAKGGFDEPTLAKIENEALLALLGISNPVELEVNLAKEAGVRPELIPSVLKTATEEVFGPVALMELDEANATGERLLPAHETGKSAPVRPTAPPRPVSPPSPAHPVPPPQPAAPIARPQVRTMASDVEAVQAPAQIAPKQAAPRPAPMQPARPVPIRPVVPAVSSVRPATSAVPEAAAVRDDLKKYGIDPYREPIE